MSAAHAVAVVDDLINNHGVDPDRLQATGNGDTRPVVPNDIPQNQAENRRVEIVIFSTTVAETGPEVNEMNKKKDNDHEETEGAPAKKKGKMKLVIVLLLVVRRRSRVRLQDHDQEAPRLGQGRPDHDRRGGCSPRGLAHGQPEGQPLPGVHPRHRAVPGQSSAVLTKDQAIVLDILNTQAGAVTETQLLMAGGPARLKAAIVQALGHEWPGLVQSVYFEQFVMQ